MAEPPPLEIVSATPTPKPFRRDGMGYLYEPCDADGVPKGVRLKADFISRRSGDVSAEIVVECFLPGVPTHLHQGRLNLAGTNGKRDLARALTEQADIFNWRVLLEEFCVAILRAERQGEPFTKVGPAGTIVQRHFLVERLLPAGRPTLMYGPWASGKGWISVGLCVAVAAGLGFAGLGVQQGPTLYLDWEDEQDVFDERVWMICRGLGLSEPPPNMHYRACRGALSGQIHQIARFVDEYGVTLTVLDSVGLAAGMVGERGSYEETALSLFDGLRHIRSTHLLIDHVSEEGRQNTKTVGKAYGSIYKMALVRNAWEIRKDQDLGATAFRVGLYHTKANHGPLLPPLGFTIDFATEGACRITPDNVQESAVLSQRLPLQARIISLLQSGPLRLREIAEVLSVAEIQARRELHQYRDRFAQTSDSRWMLRVNFNTPPVTTNGVHPDDDPPQRTADLWPRGPSENDEEVPDGYVRLDDGDVIPF